MQFKENILQVSNEPFSYKNEEEVHTLLTDAPAEYLHYLSQILSDIALGYSSIILPPKQIFQNSPASGDFRVMPCVYSKNASTVKTVKIVGTNLQQNIIRNQITVGKAFVLHPEENFISHIFEACLLSSARTGACAATALKKTVKDAHRLGIMGAGRVGYYSALYICATQEVSHVFIQDSNPQKADCLAQELQKTFPDIQIRSCLGSIPKEIDVLVLATWATQPICSPEETSATLVISLGADCNEQSELHPDWPQFADIYVDTYDSLNYGDLRTWIQQGLLNPGDVTDLLTLYKDSPAAAMKEKRRLFISTGSALFDNLTIAYLLTREEKP